MSSHHADRYRVLGEDDSLWLRLWKRYGRVTTIAASLALPDADVRERLRAAGVELRGRPRQACAPVEVPVTRAPAAPRGAQLLVPGLGCA